MFSNFFNSWIIKFVIALTIIDNKSGTLIKVNENIVYRDIGFYIFATIVTILFSLASYIYWWSATVHILYYFKLDIFLYLFIYGAISFLLK